MSKRQKFIATSIALSLGFLGVQVLEAPYRFYAIGGLGLFTLVLFYWSLSEGLELNSILLTLILPFFFTLGVGIFWFLLPSSIFARFPVMVFYAFGIYILCLTSNIYTVAAIRTIALLRAARGVGFVLTLTTSFLVYDAVLSMKLPFYFTMGIVAALSFPLFLQGLWIIPLEPKLSKDLVNMTLIFSLLIGETALSLSFWPSTVIVGSLFLTVVVYILLGLGQAKLEVRLFSQTVREYLVVGMLVFIGMFFATRWGG
jgi:hypothetical protein